MAELSKHQRIVFERRLWLEAMQKRSRLIDAVTETTLRGKQQYWDSYGQPELQERTERLEPTKFGDTPHFRRRIRPRHFKHTQAFDRDFDDIRLDDLTEPNNEMFTSWRGMFGKKKDDLIFETWTNVEYGEDGSGVTYEVPDSHILTVADSGSLVAGLTLERIDQALTILLESDVDDELEIYCLANPADLRWARLEERFTNKDFSDALGQILRPATNNIDLLGMQWRWSNRILKHATDRRYVALVVKGAIKLGMRGGTTTKFSERADLNDAEQVTMKQTMASARHFDDQLVLIEIDTSLVPGRDGQAA